jgi:phospholipid/cholesterol/gamma-HCH transport system substrate-binding protein
MGEKNNRLESIIAMCIVIFVMTVLGFVYYKYSGHTYQKSTFYAEFDSISGLNVGCPVKINGVTVGRVEKFTIDPKKNFVVIVGFSIDRALHLPEDTRASVGSETLFGSPILILSPGMSEEILAPLTIIVDTQSPIQMPELLQKFLFNSADSNDRESPKDTDSKDADSKDLDSKNGDADEEQSTTDIKVPRQSMTEAGLSL